LYNNFIDNQYLKLNDYIRQNCYSIDFRFKAIKYLLLKCDPPQKD